MKLAIIRGKVSELIAEKLELSHRKSEAFLMGMFSLIDAIMDIPINELIDDLPLNDDVKGGLLGEDNVFKDILDIIISYEKGNWSSILKYQSKYHLTSKYILDSYLEALNCINEINKSMEDI